MFKLLLFFIETTALNHFLQLKGRKSWVYRNNKLTHLEFQNEVSLVPLTEGQLGVYVWEELIATQAS